jgi:Fe-S-cluster containining protein
MISDIVWINPVVKGSCDPFGGCGVGCCQVRVFDHDAHKYNLEWCEHFETTARTCKIYETRPEGCRTYPLVRNLRDNIWNISGCGYYLEEIPV